MRKAPPPCCKKMAGGVFLENGLRRTFSTHSGERGDLVRLGAVAGPGEAGRVATASLLLELAELIRLP